ncbi:Predicted acetyltransferase [Pseudidiomarina planktonica]|uniref:Predicted acetyltransferase n=1 Tax=Pseudidiomarina planktonica TaxID=1323738 RepID=A0A1Y6EV75_9GAMM|nr:GNAT family N-acetyltransferase [Pseudidiomarina planktonica]RUO65109.1 GNAT family N-acetyltransferase [Pseudidiomarina planktonica]SMQ66457.1 Predicted acetyltransferase [Pseudidiomarina planktonica]
MPTLILPSADYQQSYINYIQELGNEERYPFPLDFDHSDFAALLKRIHNFSQGLNIPDGFVQSSTYWLVEDDEIIGCTNIRYRLNSQIEHCGGHIGLGIRPSYRGKGLGNKLLELSIDKARAFGIKTIHIHCHTHNAASRRMIESCGGQLHSCIEVDDEQISRYTIASDPL